LEIDDFYKKIIETENSEIFLNKTRIISDTPFQLGKFVFKGTLLRKYVEILGEP
jgi:hypothetical protein